MENKISTIFDEIQEFVLQYTINAIEKMVVDVSYLEGLAMNKETYQFLGLSVEDLKTLREFINHLFTQTEEFLIKITDAKFDTRNFCYWLNKSVIKSSQENENEIENLKFELNSFKFNFSRLLNFLSDDKQFYFQELQSYFKDLDL